MRFSQEKRKLSKINRKAKEDIDNANNKKNDVVYLQEFFTKIKTPRVLHETDWIPLSPLNRGGNTIRTTEFDQLIPKRYFDLFKKELKFGPGNVPESFLNNIKVNLLLKQPENAFVGVYPTVIEKDRRYSDFVIEADGVTIYRSFVDGNFIEGSSVVDVGDTFTQDDIDNGFINENHTKKTWGINGGDVIRVVAEKQVDGAPCNPQDNKDVFVVTLADYRGTGSSGESFSEGSAKGYMEISSLNDTSMVATGDFFEHRTEDDGEGGCTTNITDTRNTTKTINFADWDTVDFAVINTPTIFSDDSIRYDEDFEVFEEKFLLFYNSNDKRNLVWLEFNDDNDRYELKNLPDSDPNGDVIEHSSITFKRNPNDDFVLNKGTSKDLVLTESKQNSPNLSLSNDKIMFFVKTDNENNIFQLVYKVFYTLLFKANELDDRPDLRTYTKQETTYSQSGTTYSISDSSTEDITYPRYVAPEIDSEYKIQIVIVPPIDTREARKYGNN